MYALRDTSVGHWVIAQPQGRYAGSSDLGDALLFQTLEEVLRWAGRRAVTLHNEDGGESVIGWEGYHWQFELVPLERTVVEMVTVSAPEGGLVIR